jgi:transposase
MSVMIGIDPHKALHAACAIDRHEAELGVLVVRSGPRQLTQLLEWASPFESRMWAIEPAGGLGYLLAQQLVARGEVVVDVLSSRVRLLGSGRSSKNDANDAHAVAVAALRASSLTTVRGEDHVSVLRLLAKTQLDIGRLRSRACCRLQALVADLVAGGIGKEVVVTQVEQLLARLAPSGAASAARAGGRHAR